MLTPYTDDDVKNLGWFVDRGYFPEEVYDGLREEDGKWVLEEHIAWLLLEQDEAFMTCMGGDLLKHTLELLESIV